MNRAFLFAACLVVPIAHASAAPLVYEPFDYSAGTDLNGQSPAGTSQTWALTGDDSANNLVVTSPGLTVSGLAPEGVGNAVTYVNDGDSLRLGVQEDGTPIPSGSVFYSTTFIVNDLASTPTNNGTGSFIGGLNNLSGPQATVPGVVAAKLRFQQIAGDGSNYQIGTQSNGGASAFHSALFAPGDQVFVVLEYNIDTRVSNLWVNPNASDFGDAIAPTPDATSGVGNAIFGGIASFVLRANSVAPSDVKLDELRVGTAWADVTPVPEPTALALAGIGATALLARRRRPM